MLDNPSVLSATSSADNIILGKHVSLFIKSIVL